MRVCPGRYMDGHRHGIMADLGLPKRVMTFLVTSPSKCAGGELFMFANRADRLETFTIFQLKESSHGEARA